MCVCVCVCLCLYSAYRHTHIYTYCVLAYIHTYSPGVYCMLVTVRASSSRCLSVIDHWMRECAYGSDRPVYPIHSAASSSQITRMNISITMTASSRVPINKPSNAVV